MEILAGQHTMNGGVWKVEWNVGKKQVCGGITNGKEGNADPPYFVLISWSLLGLCRGTYCTFDSQNCRRFCGHGV